MIADYWRLMRAGMALAKHDVILPGEYQSRMPLPAKMVGRTLRIFGGGARGRPVRGWQRRSKSLGPPISSLGNSWPHGRMCLALRQQQISHA